METNIWKDGIYHYNGGVIEEHDQSRITHVIVSYQDDDNDDDDDDDDDNDTITVRFTTSSEEIETFEFRGLTQLQQIEINSTTIRRIHPKAFEDCSALTCVKFFTPTTTKSDSSSLLSPSPLSTLSILRVIENETFAFCESLQTIELPTSIIRIGQRAFRNCHSLEHVNINNCTNIQFIDHLAFWNCSSLESISIPSSIQKIGFGTFCACPNLKYVSISSHCDHLKEIQLSTFAGCQSLERIDLPDSIKVIEENVFCHCSNLSTINLPSNLIEIEKDAFLGCKSLSQIELPSTIRILGSGAFSSCSNLISVILPDELENSGRDIFRSCRNLRTVKLGRLTTWHTVATTATTDHTNPHDSNILDELIQFLCDVNVGGRKFLRRTGNEESSYPIALWSFVLDSQSLTARLRRGEFRGGDHTIRQLSVVYYLLLNSGLWAYY